MSRAKLLFDGLSVLYLEDEVLIALDVTAFLREAGFGTVSTVYKLKDATAAIESHNYELALLDINVDRGQTSLDLGARLKSGGTHVIFASGNSNDSQRLRSEGFHFIDKPFSHLALKDLITAALSDGAKKRTVS